VVAFLYDSPTKHDPGIRPYEQHVRLSAVIVDLRVPLMFQGVALHLIEWSVVTDDADSANVAAADGAIATQAKPDSAPPTFTSSTCPRRISSTS
jgi:hypothetical protein